MAESVQTENFKSAAAYFFSIVPFGIIVAVFILFTDKSRYVRFHSMQAIVLFGSLFILTWILNLTGGIGQSLVPLIDVFRLIIWVVLLIKSYRGEYFKLPFVGDFAEQQLKRVK